MTFKEYLSQIDSEIDKLTGNNGLTRHDFADTVFVHDYFEDEIPAIDAAYDILENDTIGQCWLELAAEGRE